MEVRDIIPWRRRNEEALAARDDFEDVFMSFRNEMDRVFNSFFEGFNTELAPFTGDSFSPSIDVKETDKAVEVSAELPGMEEKDIDVSFDDDGLVIKGEKRSEKDETKGGIHRMERHYGSFQRRIPVPVEIDAEKVDATFKKGVLHVTLPKINSKKTKSIKISVN